MSVVLVLDRAPLAEDPGFEDWAREVLESLEGAPSEWVQELEQDGLTDERSWSLLAWVELVGGDLIRSRSQSTLVTCAFAFALVFCGRLDRRDCSVVASVVRFAADTAGIDFRSAALEGTRLAGPWMEEARHWLLCASPNLPATHELERVGDESRIQRKPTDFNLADLERWLKGEDPLASD